MVRVGVREFKAHMGQYIRRVKAGETIVLTNRGEDVAEMSPPGRARLTGVDLAKRMVVEGRAQWSGKKFTLPPLLHAEGDLSLSDLIIQEREEGAARFESSGSEPLSR